MLLKHIETMEWKKIWDVSQIFKNIQVEEQRRLKDPVMSADFGPQATLPSSCIILTIIDDNGNDNGNDNDNDKDDDGNENDDDEDEDDNDEKKDNENGYTRCF